ncbi:hypothetical protein FOL47_008838 [Perkinsus chesapeaki]|uniref:Ubiquitin-like domain-containing protein n=1 Tax=Perkinsus chesapeaki TaxID=330153 RepID=A0A7J6LBR5_PERCH|nr:hypothetical protein FOL47_008838 [Perkinsus chesapeaki]
MPTHLLLGDAERDIPAVTIDAEVSATINDIRDKVQKATGILHVPELLSLDGGPLRDDQVLSGINHGDEQDLRLAYRECGEVSVPVKRLNGEAVHISICGSDTVVTIKDKIEGVTGIRPGEQVIAVAGSIRQDGQAIADYLKRQLTRHVIVHQFATVTIHQRPLTYGDRDIAFDVTPSTTIGQVKRIVRDKWGVPLAQQKMNDKVGELVSDHATVEDCGIENEGFLVLELKARGKLYAEADKLDGGRANIFITPSHTVDLVKEAVEVETCFPAHHQKLMCGDEEIVSGRLCDVVPEQLASVYLGINRPVMVNITDSSGNELTIPAKPWCLIKDLKRTLWRKGYPVDPQLLFDGQEVNNNERLCDARMRLVRQGARLNLNVSVNGPRYVVYIKQLLGYNKRLSWYHHDTVEDLKNRIYHVTETPPDAQRLIFAGQQLEDGRLLTSYGLINRETIHLVLRLVGS